MGMRCRHDHLFGGVAFYGLVRYSDFEIPLYALNPEQ